MSTLKSLKKLVPSTVDFYVPSYFIGRELKGNDEAHFSRIKGKIDFYMLNFMNNANLLTILDVIEESKRVGMAQSMSILTEVVKLIRVYMLSSDPERVYKTIFLVDMLIKNSGYRMHILLGRRRFMQTFGIVLRRHRARENKTAHQKVSAFAIDCIQAWGEAFTTRRSLYPHIYETYYKMRYKYHIRFPRVDFDPTRVPIFLGEITRGEQELAQQFPDDNDNDSDAYSMSQYSVGDENEMNDSYQHRRGDHYTLPQEESGGSQQSHNRNQQQNQGSYEFHRTQSESQQSFNAKQQQKHNRGDSFNPPQLSRANTAPGRLAPPPKDVSCVAVNVNDDSESMLKFDDNNSDLNLMDFECNTEATSTGRSTSAAAAMSSSKVEAFWSAPSLAPPVGLTTQTQQQTHESQMAPPPVPGTSVLPAPPMMPAASWSQSGQQFQQLHSQYHQLKQHPHGQLDQPVHGMEAKQHVMLNSGGGGGGSIPRLFMHQNLQQQQPQQYQPHMMQVELYGRGPSLFSASSGGNGTGTAVTVGGVIGLSGPLNPFGAQAPASAPSHSVNPLDTYLLQQEEQLNSRHEKASPNDAISWNSSLSPHQPHQQLQERMRQQSVSSYTSSGLSIYTTDQSSYISGSTASASASASVSGGGGGAITGQNTHSMSTLSSFTNSSGASSSNAFTPFTQYTAAPYPLSAPPSLSPRPSLLGYAYKPTTKLDDLGSDVAELMQEQMSIGIGKGVSGGGGSGCGESGGSPERKASQQQQQQPQTVEVQGGEHREDDSQAAHSQSQKQPHPQSQTLTSSQAQVASQVDDGCGPTALRAHSAGAGGAGDTGGCGVSDVFSAGGGNPFGSAGTDSDVPYGMGQRESVTLRQTNSAYLQRDPVHCDDTTGPDPQPPQADPSRSGAYYQAQQARKLAEFLNPSSDPNVEIKFFGNQRVVVKK